MATRHDPLRDAIRRRRAAKTQGNLDVPIKGSRYLGVGTHDVTILGVDTGMLETRGLLQVMFAANGDSEQTHRAQWFLLARDKTSLSYQINNMLTALFGEADDQWLAIAEQDVCLGLQIWRGMHVSITIAPTPGYLIEHGTEGYAAVDAAEGTTLFSGCATIDELKAQASTRGLKRSYNNVRSVHSVDQESNIEALNNAIAGIEREATRSTEQAYSLDAHLKRSQGVT